MQIAAQCGNGASDGPSYYPRNRVRDFNCAVSCWSGFVEWCMNISQVTAKDDEALEYLNVLVTVELAAEIHRNKPNTAIRKTVARLLPRMNHPRVKAIMVGLARQAYPSGCLLMLRRELENVVDGVVVFE